MDFMGRAGLAVMVLGIAEALGALDMVFYVGLVMFLVGGGSNAD